ncbi:MAG: hypothetical protein MUC48_01460 [Leptolyngbya sp. Prado105]|nr:hypothetical protein [Leptolyngbya sp. Prado105]
MSAVPNPELLNAIESLNYRATIGDVASVSGLNINLAEQGLLVLAAQAGGHLQVAESGDVIYQFPKNFRSILRDKDARLRWQERWQTIWRILFYLIRISFGIVLVLLILASFLAIIAITIAASSSRDDNNGGDFNMPTVWFGPDFFWIFTPDYDQRRPKEKRELNFLESIYSFLFGDGNPNADLEDRRWKTIGAVIRTNQGAVIAEQIAPYLDEVGTQSEQEYEQYMLPVLAKFDGRPEVSPDGQLIYQFPSLQTTAVQEERQWIPAFLRESMYQFSKASSGQVTLAIGLGVTLLFLAIVLTAMVGGGALKVLALLSLGYSTAFLTIPAIRYFWIKGRNQKILDRNRDRESRANFLSRAGEAIQQKHAYDRGIAARHLIQDSDVINSSDRDLIEQDIERSDQIDAEWQRRLEG